MEFPNSSVIQAADYDPDARTLDVTFTSGRRYTYFGVPDWEFDGLVTASSAANISTRTFAISMRAASVTNLDVMKTNPGAMPRR